MRATSQNLSLRPQTDPKQHHTARPQTTPTDVARGGKKITEDPDTKKKRESKKEESPKLGSNPQGVSKTETWGIYTRLGLTKTVRRRPTGSQAADTTA